MSLFGEIENIKDPIFQFTEDAFFFLIFQILKKKTF